MSETYEEALSRTEADALLTQRAAENIARASKRLVAATKLGDAGAIRRAFNEINRASTALDAQMAATADGWTFDLGSYAQAGDFRAEFLSAAAEAGLPVYEQDDRIFSYPLLLRLEARADDADCAILIDRKRTKSLRPSFLVAQLRAARSRPPRFNAREFLKALYSAYQYVDGGRWLGVELARVHELLTTFPGLAKDYGRQEFARDLAILDASGERDIDGRTLELSASTGTKGSKSKLFQVVDESGKQLVYYQIAFRERV